MVVGRYVGGGRGGGCRRGDGAVGGCRGNAAGTRYLVFSVSALIAKC